MSSQTELNLFFVLDHVIYLKGPFKNWQELDDYMEENLQETGLLYFNTAQGEMLFSPWELEVVDDPDYKETIVWV